MHPFSDAKIIDCWHKNARPWTGAVRAKRIESRRQVTDGAVLDAVLGREPRSVLDLGCGEGWLARELAGHAIQVQGIDVVPALIQAAQGAGGGDFRVASYEDLTAGKFHFAVDAVVCNFSLAGRGIGGRFMQDDAGAAESAGFADRADPASGGCMRRPAL